MTAFVILAAGRGRRMGRVGDELHKCLTPLDGRALISHQLDLAPPNARVVVVVGYRAQQVRDYLALAHPLRRFEFVEATDWNVDGIGGPGYSLLCARDAVGDDDLVYASCDTLWERDYGLWRGEDSWAGLAPVPAGTRLSRWCRMYPTRAQDGKIVRMYDKTNTVVKGDQPDTAFVGLARVVKADLDRFWGCLETLKPSRAVTTEHRDVSGFWDLIADGRLRSRRVRWLDVGDEESYRDAVARRTGYDWTKTGQATYVLPDEGQVVKFDARPDVARYRTQRGAALGKLVPQPVERRRDFISYPFVPGVTAYTVADGAAGTVHVRELLEWWTRHCWDTRGDIAGPSLDGQALHFYRNKTRERVAKLRNDLRRRAEDAVGRVDWEALVAGTVPGRWHGDLNFGNVIVTPRHEFVAIDWREDFAGETLVGDLRYDVAKLLAGCVVHWDAARRGDFRPWSAGSYLMDIIKDYVAINLTELDIRDLELIGALSLLNSAPLHAAPLDEILVARGCAWLEEVL